MGGGGSRQAAEDCLAGEQVVEESIAGRPASGRSEGDDRLRPATGRELECDVAAERVADEVGSSEPGVIHRTFDRVGHPPDRDAFAGERGTSGVTEQGRREDVVVLLEPRHDQLPDTPRVHEPVQADEGRPGAAPMERRER